MNPNAPVTESIDQRILELLGLEETFDLDYATYVQSLKEKLLRTTAFGEKLSNEDFILLKDELKRVKQKEKTKTFKIKPEKFLGKKKETTTAKISTKKLLLPSSGAITKVAEVEDKSKAVQKLKTAEKEPVDILSRIDEKLSSILETLLSVSKLQNKQLDFDRKERENKKRQEKESRLEKGGKLIGAAVQKILAPFQNIFERVWNFIKFTLLGRAFTLLMNWFADPKNKGKVETLGRFLKDWWPALLGAYGLFMTPLGGLVRTVIGTVARFTFQITKFAIPRLLSIVKANPLTSLIVATSVAGTLARTGEREKLKPEVEKQRESVKKTEEDKNAPWYQKLGGFFAKQELTTGQQQQAIVAPVPGAMYATGGYVSGEPGIDKVPAMLTDGEFVMSRGAVNKFGTPFLESLNAAGGGTNKPRVVSGTTYAASGGRVGESGGGYSGERKGDSPERLRENLNKFLRGKGAGPNFDIGNPKTWAPPGGGGRGGRGGGGGFNLPGLPSGGGGGFNLPGLPSGGGGGFNLPGVPSGGKGPNLNPESYIPPEYRDDYNKAKEAAGGVYKKGKEILDTVKKKLKDSGYLNEEGKLSGAAKNQATNFLSDLLPNLPGVNQLNKGITSQYLKSIGISKENAKYGDVSAQAMITGKSGIESAYNVGQLQVNKMSQESKKLYMKILKEKMAAGTLKSGDVINPYGMVKKNDPRYREQGSVRFHVDPKTGKGYLLDTYGFDPGKVDLGGPGSEAQKQYDEQVKSFQDPKKKIKLGPLDIPIGQIAKKLDLKPMQDATEGGGLPQYILAMRNKLFGYDAKKEGSSLDPKRFKTKAQIDELKELGDLKKFAAQISPTQKKLVDDKLKKEKVEEEKKKKAESKNQKALEAKRPWWDKMGMFGGASAEMERQKKNKPMYGPGGAASGSGVGQFQQKNNPVYGPGGSVSGSGVGQFQQKKPNYFGPGGSPKSTAKPSAKPSAKPKAAAPKPQRAWYDPRGWVGKQGGGYVDESFGMNISGGADRQLAALQPGEYILPVDIVNKLGSENLNRLVAAFDSNSTPAKLGYKSNNVPQITPYTPKSSSMTLPAIKSSSGGSGAMPSSPSSLPDFSVIPAEGAPMRMANAKLLGIVG